MTEEQPWNWNSALSQLEHVLAPNVLGFSTHFEATEIFAQQEGQTSAINVFTILVAEDRSGERSEVPHYLNPQRIRLRSLKGWFFGIERYTRPIAELVPALQELEQKGLWDKSGTALQVGKVIPLSEQFVPPDTATRVPLNRVLKNNFWNGSHVFEWSDREKKALQPLFITPRRLQELGEAIKKVVHIDVAGLSDRLGNLVVQVPVTVLMSTFSRLRSGDFHVELAWHPKATSRPLRATCGVEFDDVVVGYGSMPVQVPETPLPMRGGRGLHRGFIWDEADQTILAATGPGSFINTIALNVQAVEPEPRVFAFKQSNGSIKRVRISLGMRVIKNLVGERFGDDNGGWTQKRMYKERADRLAAERRFVQYKPAPGRQDAEHDRALDDVRRLINHYGQEGAWLWDPYLSARDILETLFHCMHSGVDLRALSGAREFRRNPPASVPHGRLARVRKCVAAIWRSPPRRPSFVETQRAIFDATESNWRGLRLEYRVKRGSTGGGFHDRFLIFPRAEEGALAWSLGTSVNSLGKEHHILQQADNGQLIKDAFEELWDSLSSPDHLIWKKP